MRPRAEGRGSEPVHPDRSGSSQLDFLSALREEAPRVRSGDGANVFTIPPNQPFLDTLASAILKGDLPIANGRAPQLIDLPQMTLMLPTRRATRALQEAFLRASGGRAMLLPKVLAIAEGQEDLTLLSGIASLDTIGTSADRIAPAVSNTERLLVLTELVMRWSKVMRRPMPDAIRAMEPVAAAGSNTPAQAAHLATELARLMDMVETEGVDLAAIAGLVPGDLAEHWDVTLEFLRIVTEFWPIHLKERGYVSPAARRTALLEAEAQRLAAIPPAGPVIVAGVTGSIPATVELMRAVALLPQGAIVLPALDMDLDDPSWQALAPAGDIPGHPEHPQYGLKKLISHLGLSRADVHVLPGCEASPAATARQKLVSETMRPAATTERWHDYIAEMAGNEAKIADAVAGLSLIEAPTQQDEAEAIALILRQTVETPGRTAALVSPDRLLARRVAVRLQAWGIAVDDSAGRPFAKTVPGAFLDLVVDAVAKDFAPAELMALLKHPLTRLGLDPFAVRRAGRALELAAFRTTYLGRGLDGVERALERASADVAARGLRPDAAQPLPDGADLLRFRHPAVRRLFDEDWHGARDLVARVRAAVAPLVDVFARSGGHPLRTFAAAHLAAAEAMARTPEAERDDATLTASSLWSGEAGSAALAFFTGLIDSNMPSPEVEAADYADLYRGLIAKENVRPRVPVHPRLSIWGPFESRLQQTDVMILGSLNDATWPESADPGPWLNRPMRAVLGLPSPEEAIGHAAHDFSSLLCAPRVYLTRAEKVEGVPTVPSRWLLRLKALLDGMGAGQRLTPVEPWLAWARQRDAAIAVAAIKAPEPRPPVSMRPRRMSVSRVETFIANPYAIFAKDILRLEPMEALGAEPGASLRGSVIHEALSRFAKAHPTQLPADPQGELYRIARGVFAEYAAHPRVAAFWLPRFERFAQWFAETEPSRRFGVLSVISETSGSLVLAAPAGAFTLTARADRIDQTVAGLIITDYKTGAAPNDKSVLTGQAPQLPLEAAISAEGGFAGVPQAAVSGLRYIRASGAEPPGEERNISVSDVATLARDVRDGLARFIAMFDDVATPYKALRRPRFNYDYDAYAHLARVAEWTAPEDNGEGGEA